MSVCVSPALVSNPLNVFYKTHNIYVFWDGHEKYFEKVWKSNLVFAENPKNHFEILPKRLQRFWWNLCQNKHYKYNPYPHDTQKRGFDVLNVPE